MECTPRQDREFQVCFRAARVSLRPRSFVFSLEKQFWLPVSSLETLVRMTQKFTQTSC